MSNLSIQHLSIICCCYKYSLFLPLCSLRLASSLDLLVLRWINSPISSLDHLFVSFMSSLPVSFLFYSHFFIYFYFLIFVIFFDFCNWFLLTLRFYRARLGSSYCVLDCSYLMFFWLFWCSLDLMFWCFLDAKDESLSVSLDSFLSSFQPSFLFF